MVIFREFLAFGQKLRLLCKKQRFLKLKISKINFENKFSKFIFEIFNFKNLCFLQSKRIFGRAWARARHSLIAFRAFYLFCEESVFIWIIRIICFHMKTDSSQINKKNNSSKCDRRARAQARPNIRLLCKKQRFLKLKISKINFENLFSKLIFEIFNFKNLCFLQSKRNFWPKAKNSLKIFIKIIF